MSKTDTRMLEVPLPTSEVPLFDSKMEEFGKNVRFFISKKQ